MEHKKSSSSCMKFRRTHRGLPNPAKYTEKLSRTQGRQLVFPASCPSILHDLTSVTYHADEVKVPRLGFRPHCRKIARSDTSQQTIVVSQPHAEEMAYAAKLSAYRAVLVVPTCSAMRRCVP